MGDALTHLASHDDISVLLQDAYRALAPNGVLILTCRDFTSQLHGLDRIVPVRSDDNQVMTCILDYGPNTVTVTDLVHVPENDV